ncbi:cytidylate kinase [Synergistales bacterium]|nr:cytidylate kinase [Synergistales bacterium]
MSELGCRPIITLDGPAGAGKSSAAREAAKRLSLPFLDTGAIYRAITLSARERGISPKETDELKSLLSEFSLSFRGDRVVSCGKDVTEAIRTPEIDMAVSAYSALPMVRDALLSIQRNAASDGLVTEGRDMGTVVFPKADLKIFLTASPEKRARRRYDERISKGEPADLGEILEQVKTRDALDEGREAAPLRAAEDAIILDSTDLSLEEVVEKILQLARLRKDKNMTAHVPKHDVR